MSNHTDLRATGTWQTLEQHGRRVPSHLWLPITRYVERGLKSDVWLVAIFSNDLRNTVAFSDTQTLIALTDVVKFIYRHLPNACQGCAANVERWGKIGGLSGQAEVAA